MEFMSRLQPKPSLTLSDLLPGDGFCPETSDFCPGKFECSFHPQKELSETAWYSLVLGTFSRLDIVLWPLLWLFTGLGYLTSMFFLCSVSFLWHIIFKDFPVVEYQLNAFKEEQKGEAFFPVVDFASSPLTWLSQ